MILAAAIVQLALAAAEPLPQDVRVAVIAGNNHGLDFEQPLEFAEEDARRVHALLTSLGSVAARRTYLVLGGGPDDLLRAVSEATGQLRELAASVRTTLVFYVSAHADEEALHLGGDRLPLARLRALLSGAPAHFRVVIIDACRLPVSARAKGGRPGPEVPVVFDRSAQVEGEVVIAAAGPGEWAQEWSHLRGSLFTHHLLTGLRGAADFDGNGRVTLAEAYAYAFRNTLSKAAEAGLAPQRPSFDFRVAGHGDWVFSQTGEAAASLTLGPDLSGRLWVLDGRSDLVAEVEKRAGEPIRLALVSGRYRVVRLEGAHAHASDVSLAFGGEKLVTASSLVRLPASRALAKGGPPLVLRPWVLSASYGMEWSRPGTSAQHALEMGVERAIGDWSVRLAVGAGASTIAADGVSISQRDLRMSGSLAWTFPLSIATVGAGLEARPRLMWQRIDRYLADAAQRLPVVEHAVLLAVGPVATVSFPILDRLRLGLGLGVGLEWAPDVRGRVGVRYYAQPRALAGWSY